MDDDGSTGEYGDSSGKGRAKLNGKYGSGPDDGGGEAATNDGAKVRDNSGRFVASSNGRSVEGQSSDAPQ